MRPIHAWAAAVGAALLACNKPSATTSPERLVAAHLKALDDDDPAAAYALLAPEVQAKTPYPEFEARWRADKKEHEAMLAAAKAMDDRLRTAILGGTTVHEGGHVLTWTQIDGEYVVTSGLPGRVHTATPAAAIRAFIAAVRSADWDEVTALMTDDLAAELRRDWERRADAIEAALQKPGTLQLSSDLHRAFIRYDPQHVLTLEQTAAGWRIVSLQ